MNTEKTYPIAEIFNSIQGEGVYHGTPMTFVRLAGCNVGKYPTKLSQLIQLSGGHDTVFTQLDPPETTDPAISCRHSICESWDGVHFVCDTDYHMTSKKSLAELKELITLPRVCLTGGEPFMHDLEPLYDLVVEKLGKELHIETSGTLPIKDFYDASMVWITCSPKAGFLDSNSKWIDEWKFVFTDMTNLAEIKEIVKKNNNSVYLTPINDMLHMDLKLAKRCVDWILANEPTWRLNLQVHKLLEMR